MTTWWVWLLAGLGLFVIEAITPGGFYFLFFAVAAVVVGVLAALLELPDWLLLGVFSVLSVGSLALFRGRLLRRLEARTKASHPVDAMAGEIATLTDDLGPHATGQAWMRGTVWSVRNASRATLSRGQRCRVERVDGLTLVVLPE